MTNMPFAEASDESLVRLMQCGSCSECNEALVVLMERYGDMVQRFTLRRLGRRDLADDATQLVWVRVYRGIGTYRHHRGMFMPWLKTVMANTTYSFVRQLKKYGVHDERLHEDQVYGVADGQCVFDVQELLVRKGGEFGAAILKCHGELQATAAVLKKSVAWVRRHRNQLREILRAEGLNV